MRFTRLVLALSVSVVLAFGQAQEKPDSGRKNEGIRVHGHWVLEIKNPDGSLASRHEFENSLSTATNSGPTLLSGLLSGQYAAGPWTVYVQFNDVAGTALSVAESAAVCTHLLSQNPTGGPCSSTLNVSSGTPLVLQGTTPAAPSAGTLIQVGSLMYPCAGSSSPVACEPAAIPTTTFGALFTTAVLSGITIQAGQAVSITVSISFS